MMSRRVRWLLGLSLPLSIAAPATAERPTPSPALRFQAALSGGDLRDANRVIAPGAQILRDDLGVERTRGNTSPETVPLANIAAAVRGCSSTPASSSRDLAVPSLMHVFLSWRCSDGNWPSLNIDVTAGRVTRVSAYFGPPIPLVDNPPGWVAPTYPATELANSFLRQLVGDRDLRAAHGRLTAKASLLDRRSGRPTSLAAVANHVEACALREASNGQGRTVVTQWTCRSGPRAIAISFDRNDVSQVEIVSPTSQADH